MMKLPKLQFKEQLIGAVGSIEIHHHRINEYYASIIIYSIMNNSTEYLPTCCHHSQYLSFEGNPDHKKICTVYIGMKD